MENNKYFNNLNYTLGNEDSSFEYEVLQNNVNHVFSVAGSGSRVIPLLAKKPKLITCVDTSKEQLYLTELRIESLRTLDYESFLTFWGYPPKAQESLDREYMFNSFKLSSECKHFFRQIFEENKWGSLLYLGRWEKTFVKLSKINNLLTGKKGTDLFEQKEDTEYYDYLKHKFPHLAWKATVFLLGNAAVFNTFLYKGHFPKKNIPETLYLFYIKSFNKLLMQGPARNNFLLQLLFFGKLLFSEGNPIECRQEIFLQAKEALKLTKINYIQGDFIEQIKKNIIPIDFISFSDIPSYFNGEIQKTFLNNILENLSKDCLLVIRNYLRIPEKTDTHGYEDTTKVYGNLIEKEKIQMYVIKVFKKTL